MTTDSAAGRPPAHRLPRRSRRPGWWPLAALAGSLAVALGGAATVGAAPAASTAADPAACTESQPGSLPPQPTPTTIDTLGQAFSCILDHYFSGSRMDDRTLLASAFAGVTEGLSRSGHDTPAAVLPALRGDRQADWAAVAAVLHRVVDPLTDSTLRETLAAAAITSMVASLHDDHAQWVHGGGPQPSLGVQTNVFAGQLADRPGTVRPPVYVTTVLGGAAKDAGLRPGDVIEAVDGAPMSVDGTVSAAVLARLSPAVTPDKPARPVRLRLFRPATGRTWTAALTPGPFQPDPGANQQVSSRLVGDDLAYVRVAGFSHGVADQALAAIADLRTGRTLRGVILDLRGNHGGDPVEVNRLLGAFAHGKITAYKCTVDGACTGVGTDDSVPLLGLPLAVLTDLGCASACEHFSSAVQDLHLGTLVGSRTAGAIAGEAGVFLLGNGTAMFMPSTHHLGPNHEITDGIGVPPDHDVPLTARDVSLGRDPGLAAAAALLRR
jgi:carboxyl-terminal processing protease